MDCRAVGPSVLAPGFVRREDGWGARAILPDHACSASAMAILGERECQPVDDCNSAFPPPNADVVVRATARASATERAAALVDAVAQVRRGGTVAIEEGVWETGLEILKDVNLVGRCASKTVLRSPGPRPTGNETPGTKAGNELPKGIDVATKAEVSLRGLTIEGFDYGIYADRGHVVAERIILSGNRVGAAFFFGAKLDMTHALVTEARDFPRVDAQGISAMMRDTRVSLDGIEVRGMDTGISAASAQTAVTIRRSVVHREHHPVYRGFALEAFRGATITVEESAIHTELGQAVFGGRFLGTPPAEDAKAGPAKLVAKRSVFSHEGSPSDDPRARTGAANFADGFSADLEDCTVHHASFGGIAVQSGASLAARRTAFVADATEASVRLAISIYDSGSRAMLTDSAVVGAQQAGIFLHEKGASLSLVRSFVTGTHQRRVESIEDLGGTGQAIAVGHGAHLSLDDSSLVNNEGIAVLALDNAEVSIKNSLVDQTKASELGLGVGLLCVDSRVTLEDSMVRASTDAALAFEGASASILSGSVLLENAIGLRVAEGIEVRTSEGDPLPLLSDNIVYLTDTDARGNALESTSEPVPIR